MSERLPLNQSAKRLQKLWIGFTLSAVFISRLDVYVHASSGVAKFAYALLCLVAVVGAVVLYRLDIADDLRRARMVNLNKIPWFGSAFGSKTYIVLLCFGLAYGIWTIRNESLWLILILPVNALWIFTIYRMIIFATLRKERKTIQ